MNDCEKGDEVLRGEGNVGELLFAAGGTTHLREKQQLLNDAASKLFKPGGSKPPINATLRSLKEVENQLRDLQRSPEKWAQHDTEHRRLVEQEEMIRADLADCESVKSRLDRYYKAWRLLEPGNRRVPISMRSLTLLPCPMIADDRFRHANQKRTFAKLAKRRRRTELKSFKLNSTSWTCPRRFSAKRAALTISIFALEAIKRASPIARCAQGSSALPEIVRRDDRETRLGIIAG